MSIKNLIVGMVCLFFVGVGYAKVVHLSLSGEVNSQMSTYVGANTSKLVNTDVIVLDINSPGGDVQSMLEIMNNLHRSGAHVVAVVNSYAASAAAFIAFTSDEVYINPSALVIFHVGRVYTPTGEIVCSRQQKSSVCRGLYDLSVQLFSYVTKSFPHVINNKEMAYVQNGNDLFLLGSALIGRNTNIYTVKLFPYK